MKKQSKQKVTIQTQVKELSDKIDLTRSDLNTTRQELNNRIGFLAAAIQKNEVDIQSLAQNVATKADVQTIISTIDAFTKKVTVYENKALTHDFRINEIEPRIEDHEKRISALESR